jgi:hypothetical protein
MARWSSGRKGQSKIPLFVKCDDPMPAWRRRELEELIGRRLTYDEMRRLDEGESVYLGEF